MQKLLYALRMLPVDVLCAVQRAIAVDDVAESVGGDDCRH